MLDPFLLYILQNEEYYGNRLLTCEITILTIAWLLKYSLPKIWVVLSFFVVVSSQEQSKVSFTTSFGKLSSDAITQITTESPEKTTFSSEIFIHADDRGQGILDPMAQKPSRFASSSSVQQIPASHGKDGKRI